MAFPARLLAAAAALLLAGGAQAVKPRTAPLAPARAGANGFGELLIGGKRIPRLAARPLPMSPQGQTIVNQFFAASLALPPGLGLTNYREKGQALRAATEPTPVSGKPFGKLAVFMPGLGGFGPSAAFVYRLARYADKVVVTYQGTTQASRNTLRIAAHIDGVPVPKSLVGKILMMGEPANRAILSPDQASDLLITYYELMRQKQALLGFDPLTSKSTLFGHSEGSFINVITRERLEQAGFPDTIGKVVIMAGGLGATQMNKWAPMLAMQAYQKVVEKLGQPSNLAGVVHSYERIIGSFAGKERLVDLGVAGVIGPPIRLQGLHIEGMNDIRPGMRFAAVGEATFDALSKPWKAWSGELLKMLATKGNNEDDGIVKVAWARFGKKFLLLKKPHDHANMIEDPSAVDEMAQALAN